MRVREKIIEIFRDVFNDRTLAIHDTTTAEDIEAWDSLANIELLTVIEKEFNIRFNMQDIQELENVGDMICLVERMRGNA